MSKIIAIIGATGAQGLPIIKHLLLPKADGSPSEWKVRALTRNPEHRRAKELEAMGVELVKGTFMDSSVVHTLFEGAYGAFVNTDSFTVGEAAELIGAMTIWEIARQHKIRHYVWSNLEYVGRITKYNPIYQTPHYNAKGRFGEFLASQPNDIDDPEGTMWTLFTTGPYMEMLNVLFAPMNIREDGTRVWSSPIGDGSFPLISLEDIGWYARHIFDNAPSTTGMDFKLCSEMATFPKVVETFQRVTGLKAEYKPVSFDEYFAMWKGDFPLASEMPKGSFTWEQNFRAFFHLYADNIIKRDMDWLRNIHEPLDMEKWMRETNYQGIPHFETLKNNEDDSMPIRRNEELQKAL